MRGWHATPTSNADQIARDGLQPHWEWMTSSLSWMEFRKYVHVPVHVSEEVAHEEFIGDLYGCDAVTVYEVDLDGLTLHPGDDGPGTFAVYEWVSPERLTLTHVRERGNSW